MTTGPSSEPVHSPWSPFHHRTYAVIWTATVVANIGGWMYSAAAAWLMTSLDADPVMVSLVQVATSLPMFLFALPAGALADIIDKRRFLIVVELGIMVVSALFATMVTFDLVTPVTLLSFMFVIGAGSALTAPAWQSIVPALVPKPDLPAAVAANSVGINISRAVGPALSGIIAAGFGIAAPFWLDAFSNFGTVGALVWWRTPPRTGRRLPAERLASAIRTGARYARNNPPLRATLFRAVAFFLFASAYWALLPLVARTQMTGGAQLYGVLLGAIGVGAIGGAFTLPRLKAKLGPDRLVAAGTVGTAVALVLFGAAHSAAIALLASLIAGVSWIATLSSLNVSAQLALPEWVRGRGLAIYVTVLFGAMTVGSVAWGKIAATGGLPMAHFLAALGALVSIPLTWRSKLQTGAGLDLTPSMSWPEPIVAEDLQERAGPVMIAVEYCIAMNDRDAFLLALERVALERRRDGAYAWGIFEDASEAGRFVETFLVESWLEHLRQHERVTKADSVLQERIERLLLHPAKITHLVTAERGREPPKGTGAASRSQ
ncbi:MFS transporter [Paraburkholderia sp. RL18-103-BIB-C]|uniref:MFS transporter n=1 Tax=Paraburkholderia sp. RL18-103-BIB-C TaxID=3031637 RepID=UPI0038BDFC45